MVVNTQFLKTLRKVYVLYGLLFLCPDVRSRFSKRLCTTKIALNRLLEALHTGGGYDHACETLHTNVQILSLLL